MTTATCVDCGHTFYRDEDEGWKLRCFECWLLSKRTTGMQPVAAADPIRDELRDRLRGLLSLCHPDKHNGSALANSVTQWLLEVRDRLERHAREPVR